MKSGATACLLPLVLLSGCAVLHPGHEAGEAPSPQYVGQSVEALPREAVGDEMDRLSRRLAEQFAGDIKTATLQLSRLPGGLILLELSGAAAFESGSAELPPAALDFYARLADVIRRNDATVLHVIAHADAASRDDTAQSLSERRAASAASYLTNLGVPGTRLRYEGRGAREPLATSDTAEGQRRNRRLDFVVRPVVDGREVQAWMPPPYLGG